MTQEEIKQAIEAKQTELEAKTAEVEQAVADENVELSQSLMSEAKALQAEIDELKAQLEVEADKVEEKVEEEERSEVEADSTTVENLDIQEQQEVEVAEEAAEKKDEVISDLKAQIEELKNKNTENEGETRSMTNLVEEVVLNNENTQVAEYRNFLMTGEKRGVTTVDAGVVVPEEVVNSIEKLTEDLDSLEKYVTVKAVNNLSGSYPVRNADTVIAPLPTVAELEESPELGLRKLGNQEYKIETHRGLVKASWEALDDGVEVESIINEEMAEAIVATKNKKILDAMATLETKSADSLDELKTIINTGIAKRYAKQIIVSNDVYDALDKLKDSNGQYLLQPSVTSETGTKLFGKDLVLLDSEIIGEGVMYIGSLKDAVIMFLRKELYVNYEIWNQYGKVFTPIVRLDAKVKNPKAVVKVNFATVPTV